MLTYRTVLAHFALIALIVIHGLIHLLGFVKAFGLAKVPQLSGATLLSLPPALDKLVGALWLLSCLGLLGAALALLVRHPSWWLIAAVSLVLSQVLILHAWPDAKAGTLANVVIALAVTLAWADARFVAQTHAALDELYADLPTTTLPAVTEAELAALPTPVQRWLRRAGVPGKPPVRTARVEQTGLMRTAPEQAGMPTVARQWFRIDEPGFVWDARVRMFRVLPVFGRDSYLHGKGRMRIEAAALVPIVDGHGAQIDQGTMLRFMAELMWLPSAALHPALHWEAVDDAHAAVTMTHRGVTARAVLAFDAEGRLVGLEAQRYMGSGEGATLERWTAECREWKRLADGYEIPTRGAVSWKLEAGDFEYFPWQITAIAYDGAEVDG